MDPIKLKARMDAATAGAGVTFGGWSGAGLLSDLLNDAKQLARVDDYAHLGADATAQTRRMAEWVNRAVEEIAEANPAMAQVKTTLALVADTATYSLPSGLQGTAIFRIQYQDGTDPQYDLWPLEFYDAARIAQLPESWRNGEASAAYPQGWGLTAEGTGLEFFPRPSAAATLEIYYRAAMTAVTAANVAAPDAVTLSPVMARWQDVYALRIAIDLARPINLRRAAELRQEYAQRLDAMQRTIARRVAGDQAGTSERGRPSRILNMHAFFNMSPIGNLRRTI